MNRPEGIVATLPTFAAELGMTRDVLRRVVSEGGVRPVGGTVPRPLYRLADVYRAIAMQGDGAESNPHSRLALARAIKTEDEIRVRRRELLDSWEVEQMCGHLGQIVAHSFETATDGLERDVGLTPRQSHYLEKHFDRCRERLAHEWEGATDGDKQQP